MSLVGELTYFLGLQVWQTNSGIFISHAKYAKNLVSKFELGITKHRRTLIGTHDKINKDKAMNGVYPTLYRSMIRSLLYLTVSRSNVCYSVGVCARYQASLNDSHLLVVKKIIKYVSGTVGYGI